MIHRAFDALFEEYNKMEIEILKLREKFYKLEIFLKTTIDFYENLEEKTDYQRGSYFVAHDLLAIINNPDTDQST